MVYMKNDIDDSNGGGGGDGGELFHRHFLAIIIQLFFSFERGKQHFPVKFIYSAFRFSKTTHRINRERLRDNH